MALNDGFSLIMRPTETRRGSENHPNFLHFLQILTDLPRDQLLLCLGSSDVAMISLAEIRPLGEGSDPQPTPRPARIQLAFTVACGCAFLDFPKPVIHIINRRR